MTDVTNLPHVVTEQIKPPTPLLKFFKYEHLPEPLRTISQSVSELAHLMDKALPDGAEKTTGLRKLLEAKDCFVRTLVK